MENQALTPAQSIVEKLSDKVSLVATKYSTLKDENSALNDEVTTLNATIELKNKEIAELKEQNEMKELEMEDIISRVESILG